MITNFQNDQSTSSHEKDEDMNFDKMKGDLGYIPKSVTENFQSETLRSLQQLTATSRYDLWKDYWVKFIKTINLHSLAGTSTAAQQLPNHFPGSPDEEDGEVALLDRKKTKKKTSSGLGAERGTIQINITNYFQPTTQQLSATQQCSDSD